MRTDRRTVLAGVLVGLLGLLAGCAGGSDASQTPVADVSVPADHDGLNGVLLPQAYHAADVRLRATTGGTYDVATTPHRSVTLVFFGYTHCPDVCQVVMANIASALTRLTPQQRRQVAMTFVTTDPARDTTAVLTRYLARFDPGFVGLTGPLPTVVRVGKAFDVFIEKGATLPSGGYDVTHGTQVVGLLPDGTAPLVWAGGTSPAQLAEDLNHLLAGDVHGVTVRGGGS